jgi:apolipoprotein N-acyltransferase
LIVWPEAAVPATAQRVASFLSAMNDRAAASGSALVTGIPTRDNQGFHNSVLALGSASGQYDKTRLVPFGEYVPLQGLLRGAIAFFDLPMSNFSLGARYQPPLQVGERRLAVAICYEVVYPDLVARITADASMLLTVSNDAWFGDSLALPQHLQMAQMRAAENAKPLLRATNNGLTAIVDHRGRMVDSIAPFERGELTADIQPRSGRTPFSRWGSWPSIALCLAIICGLGLARRRQNGAIMAITKS